MAPNKQNEMLNRMLEPVANVLTRDVAQRIADLRADAVSEQRMQELGERCNEGTLQVDERIEYEAYVAAANMIAILQAKSRHLLLNGHRS
jgi:hypothetical protein